MKYRIYVKKRILFGSMQTERSLAGAKESRDWPRVWYISWWAIIETTHWSLIGECERLKRGKRREDRETVLK